MTNGKIPNINNKFYGEKLVEVTFPDSTSSLGFDEYNAVLNNVNSSVSSSIIMDADYALNARIPTNNDRLLSGTAQRMEIQDSNYSSVAWTSPRYVGSKTISATYNDYQESGSSVTFADGTVGTWKGDQVFDEYPSDETFTRGNPLGKVPAVDLYSTHFVLFDRIEIDSALYDRDVFHCLYLIDDQGNKVPLTYKNKNLVDLRRLFIQGSNAEVVFLGQNDQELLDDYPITQVGIIAKNDSLITNDIFLVDVDGNFTSAPYGTNPPNDYTQGEAPATSQYVFQFHSRGKYAEPFTFNTNCTAGIRFAPSLFSASFEGNEIYKLTYSLLGSGLDRFSYLDGGATYFLSDTFIKHKAGHNLKNTATSNAYWVCSTSPYLGNTSPFELEYFALRFNTYDGHVGNYIMDNDPYPIMPDNGDSSALAWKYPTATGMNDGKTEGRYINNPQAIDPKDYTLNENSLDPFYILTYNPNNQKVFEGTIYETTILNADFQTQNPGVFNNQEIGGVATPQFLSNTPTPEVSFNLIPTPPQSRRNNNPISVGDQITFQNCPLSNIIPSNAIDSTWSNLYDITKQYFDPTIAAATQITEISIGEIDEEFLCSYSTTSTTPQGYRLTAISSFAYCNNSLGCEDYTTPPYIGGMLYEGDVIAITNTYQNDDVTEGLGLYSSNDPGTIIPDDIHMLYFNPSSSQYMGPTDGGSGIHGTEENQSPFFNTLSHGGIIELTQWEDKYTSINSGNTPIPEEKVWRYLILRAPDYYDGSTITDYDPWDPSNTCSNGTGNVIGFGGTTGGRPYYRFYVQYLNGHNAEPLNHGGSNSFLTQVPTPSSTNKRIVVNRILRMEDPYIKIEQLTGGDLTSPNGLINQPSTVMGTTSIFENEQYIESQNLEGTGVGVLIPDQYDPKLREQLPDIINKTGIDINSLVQGNN